MCLFKAFDYMNNSITVWRHSGKTSSIGKPTTKRGKGRATKKRTFLRLPLYSLHAPVETDWQTMFEPDSMDPGGDWPDPDSPWWKNRIRSKPPEKRILIRPTRKVGRPDPEPSVQCTNTNKENQYFCLNFDISIVFTSKQTPLSSQFLASKLRR